MMPHMLNLIITEQTGKLFICVKQGWFPPHLKAEELFSGPSKVISEAGFTRLPTQIRQLLPNRFCGCVRLSFLHVPLPCRGFSLPVYPLTRSALQGYHEALPKYCWFPRTSTSFHPPSEGYSPRSAWQAFWARFGQGCKIR